MTEMTEEKMRALAQRTYADKTEPRPLPEGHVLDPFVGLPGESAEAFADYECYRDLGPGRTLTEVTRRRAKTIHLFRIRSQRERWHERAALYDAWAADEQRRALGRAFDAKADTIAERRFVQAEEEWRLKNEIVAKAEQMLKWPIVRVEKDGKTYNPAKWSFYTVVQMLELASTLGRRAVELPTSYTQVDQHFTDHTNGGIDLSALSPEQRAQIEEIQTRMATQILAILSGDEPVRTHAEIVIPAEAQAPPDWYPGAGKMPSPVDEEEK